MLECLNPLLQLEMAKIFLHHVRHRHPQRRREILRRHGTLLFRIFQDSKQTVGEALSISRRIKLYRQFLALCHLAEICKVRTHDWHTEGTG